MLSDLDKLYEYPGYEDENMIYALSRTMIQKQSLRLKSVNYLEQNNLDQEVEYRQWLVDNNWKISKLKKGFKVMLSGNLNHIKKHKDNYIDLDELQEIFYEDNRPSTHQIGEISQTRE